MNGEDGRTVCPAAIRFGFVDIHRPVVTDSRVIAHVFGDFVCVRGTRAQSRYDQNKRLYRAESRRHREECAHLGGAARERDLAQECGDLKQGWSGHPGTPLCGLAVDIIVLYDTKYLSYPQCLPI